MKPWLLGLQVSAIAACTSMGVRAADRREPVWAVVFVALVILNGVAIGLCHRSAT